MCRDCENAQSTARAAAGDDPALRFAHQLRRQGFRPTRRFVIRFLRRVAARGRGFDPRAFGREFLAARHYRPAAPGGRARVAVVRGVGVIYRSGRPGGGGIVLVGVLPAGARPPLAPARAPALGLASEADFQSASTYAQQQQLYQQCLNAYRPTPGAPKGGQHGSTYQRARQAYLRCQSLDPNAAGFIRGWSAQEQRRQRLAAQRRPAGFKPTGQAKTAARGADLRAIAADKSQSDAARRWAADQLRRLARGQGRLQALRAGHTVGRTNLRGVPGRDVGHPQGYVKGSNKKTPRKALQDPRTFRTELATQNRARPALARRLGLPKAYFESDPWD